ncbi:alpha/beta hydrolase [Pseudarthrobacter sp. S9]|uniref:alpha/beta hydrolase n=1 Tax=Pseudarthrobacter sp. S9 TaxID=3418421 RepID=UPI003CFFA59C
MEKPLLGRRRLLELGAGTLTAAALAACTPATEAPAGAPAADTAATPSAGSAGSAGSTAEPLATSPQVEVTSGSFVSAFRPDISTGWSVAAPVLAGPAGQQMLPVAVFLHGTDSNNRFPFDVLGAQAVLQRHLGEGGQPFAIASVDGGDSWWHPRADGTDTQSMLLAEFLPLLAARGLDTGRLGLFGLSMGGFGVLLLASQGKIPGLRAVAAMSPAVWSAYDPQLEDAFDSPEDFAANDVFALRPQLEALPKRIDCGTEDALLATVQDYVSALPGPIEGGFQPGGHEEVYWRLILPEVLAFLARNLG